MLLFGALSGASAELVVYPMEVIRRRMQMQAASAGKCRHLHNSRAGHADGMQMQSGTCAGKCDHLCSFTLCRCMLPVSLFLHLYGGASSRSLQW